MATNYLKGLYKEYELVLSQNEKLESDYKALRIKYQLMHKEVLRLNEVEAGLLETTARMELEK